MSDLLSRMISRASGTGPVVRSMASRGMPLGRAAEPELLSSAELDYPVSTPAAAAPRSAHAPAAAQRAVPELQVNRATVAAPNLEAPLPSRTPLGELARSNAPSPRHDAIVPPLRHESVIESRIEPLPHGVERARATRASTVAEPVPAMTALVGAESVSVPRVQTQIVTQAALEHVASHEPAQAIAGAELQPRAQRPRAAAPLARMDLQQALGAVGRALAQPPRARAAATSIQTASDVSEEVQITIGHIDVRAATPTAPPAQPARREPSITLAQYLRRTPGSAR